MNRRYRPLPTLLAFAIAASLVTLATAQANTPQDATRATAAETAQAATAAPVAAHYKVTVVGRVNAMRPAPGVHDWYFYRQNDRITLIKGDLEEQWRRLPDGSIPFERIFHADQRVVEYSAGELRTLGVTTDWAALGSFIDPAILKQMKLAGSSGRGAALKQRYTAQSGDHTTTIEWLPEARLPARLERRVKGQVTMRYELVSQAAQAPSTWPVPGGRSADYLHVDAADFGDMGYDPFVAKAEAMDVRTGWRAVHAHD